MLDVLYNSIYLVHAFGFFSHKCICKLYFNIVPSILILLIIEF